METDALRTLERASALALDEAMAGLCDLRLLLHSHLNMAHIRCLYIHTCDTYINTYILTHIFKYQSSIYVYI
jgi:hypothetical protein